MPSFGRHGSREVRPLTDRRPESLTPVPPELPSHSGPERKRYAVATVTLHKNIDWARLRDCPSGRDGLPGSVLPLPGYPNMVEGDVLSFSFLRAPQSAGTLGTHFKRRPIHSPHSIPMNRQSVTARNDSQAATWRWPVAFDCLGGSIISAEGRPASGKLGGSSSPRSVSTSQHQSSGVREARVYCRAPTAVARAVPRPWCDSMRINKTFLS
jgi:hypothetical protein